MLVLVLAFLGWQRAAGQTIAYWQFQPGNPGADSSGNGHDLAVTNLTFTSDAPTNAPDATNSAVFDGATSFAQTAASLDLSNYTAFTIEWFMKSSQPNLGMIFELSPNFNNNPGAFYADINEQGTGGFNWATLTTKGYDIQGGFIFPQDGLWHHYAVTINTVVTNLSTRLTIWVDGILQTNVTGGIGSGSFGGYPLFIGSRDGSAFFFNGQMDDMRISQGVLTPDQFLIHEAYPNAQLAIINQPTNVTTTVGGSPVNFQAGVSATGIPGDAVLYQWQVEAPGSTNWISISGAILPVYQVPQPRLADNGTQYRVIATAPGGPSVTSAAATLTVNAPTSPTIAYWQFEPGNPGLDSSGNGHDLTVNNLTFSADAPTNAPDATNSAVFDGATSFAQTAASLDLSLYTAFTIEWFMKSSQPNLGMIFELSPNFNNNAGAFASFINGEGTGSLDWATLTANGSAIQNGNIFPQDGLWHHYAVTVNTLVTNLSTRLTIWVNGILQTNVTGGIGSGSFGMYPFFVGSRDGNSFFFNGQLDDMRISQGVLTPDQFLIHEAYPDAQLTVTNQPADVTTTEGSAPVNFQVEVSATGMPAEAVLYQWQEEAPGSTNWISIPGAILPSYAVSQPRVADSGTQYRVIATAPGGPSVTSAAATLTVNALNGSTIAYWQFEPGNPGLDSSGNGHDLTVNNLTFTTDAPTNAPDATNSAVFDGATSFAETASPLDLSLYNAFTIEWFMKSSQPNLGMLFELSPNYNNNPGAFYADINESGQGDFNWATHTTNGLDIQGGFIFPQDGLWHHYAVTVNTLLTNLSTRLTIWVDGILQTNVVGGIGSGSFSSYPLFIGARGGNNFFFSGQLDDVRISRGVLTPDQFLIHEAYPNAQLTVTNQPADVTTTNGGMVGFQVAVDVANMPADAVLYQWQEEAPGSSNWVAIPGAILSDYQLPAPAQSADSGTQYRVVASAPGGPSVTSATATLTVISSAPTIGTAFSNATLTLTWSSGVLQATTNLLTGPWADVSGASSPYNITPTGSQMFFRLRQ